MTPEPPRGEPAAGDILREQLSNRGNLIDSSLPTAVFLVAYLVSGSQLRVAVVAALAAGVVVAGLRLLRHESLQHVLGGFLGVVIAAVVAHRTGAAEDFFLPGLLLNVAYGAAFLVSILVRRPLVGLGVSLMSPESDWRGDPDLARACYRASWVWVALFGVRLLVQVPLYLAGSVEALGVAKLVLGFPAFALAGLLTYRLLQPALAARRSRTGDAGPAGER